MIKQDFYIANLIARYLSEEITPEETIKLTAWREESTAHEILFKKICDEETKSNISGKYGIQSFIRMERSGKANQKK